MRGVQEKAAIAFLNAWAIEIQIRDLTDQRVKLNERIAAARLSQESELLLIGELRFSVGEMRSVVSATRAGMDVYLDGGRIEIERPAELSEWEPKFPKYGGGHIRRDGDDDDKRGTPPRPPEPTE